MPMKIRYNFETNSSSQHSLSTRKDSGDYTKEELARSEALYNRDVIKQDAIIVMKESNPYTNFVDNVWSIRNGVFYFWGSDFDFAYSAMQVLQTFEQKVKYVLATIYSHKTKGWEKRKEEVDKIFQKVLPNIEIDYSAIIRPHFSVARVTKNILFPFLKKHKISLEEFLTDGRYIIIIDYAEYNKMKWLNMVNEDDILFEYHSQPVEEVPFVLQDGIWKIKEDDLFFGKSPFRVLGTPEGKARYALASQANVNEVINILREVYPDLVDIEVIREYHKDTDYMGAVDDYAMPTDIPLREFILNKKYIIIADGDEYCIWNEFTKSPLFKSQAFDCTGLECDDYD